MQASTSMVKSLLAAALATAAVLSSFMLMVCIVQRCASPKSRHVSRLMRCHKYCVARCPAQRVPRPGPQPRLAGGAACTSLWCRVLRRTLRSHLPPGHMHAMPLLSVRLPLAAVSAFLGHQLQ